MWKWAWLLSGRFGWRKKIINLQGEVVRDIPVNWCKSKLLSFPFRGRLSSNFSASHFRLGEESLLNLSSRLGSGKASGTQVVRAQIRKSVPLRRISDL